MSDCPCYDTATMEYGPGDCVGCSATLPPCCEWEWSATGGPGAPCGLPDGHDGDHDYGDADD